MLAQVIAVVSYSLFVFLNAVSILPRIAGSQVENNALGYSFSQMVSTIKRVFIFIYPPLLGWITLKNGIETLITTILFSYLISLFFIFLSYLMRFFFIRYFIILIKKYSEGYSLIKSIAYAFYKENASTSLHHIHLLKEKSSNGVSGKIFYTSAWVFLANGSSLFIINILGAIYSDKAAIVYQLVGIVNALGTIVMAFFLDPMLSRIFEGNKEHLLVYKSLTLAQFINSILLGPLIILTVYVLFN